MEGVGLRERVHERMGRVKRDLAEIVLIRSVADPSQYLPEECAKAAAWVIDAFTDAGLRDLRLIDTAEGCQAVYGERAGPPDAPTVLLYAHYDVHPTFDETAWHTPPFDLTEREGRWYGRGAADCKGNILMHLTALRALGDRLPVSVKLIVDGARERDASGLEQFVPRHPDLLRADAILLCDTGNAAVGVPTVTTTSRGRADVVLTVTALPDPLPAGRFSGPAPDALAGLIHMLATLRDTRGNTTVRGLYSGQKWDGFEYRDEQFRRDARIPDGVELLGDGSVGDMVWARPAVTVLGIDCPPATLPPPARAPSAYIAPTARARVNLRVPPGMDPAKAQQALVAHLETVTPWGLRVDCEREPLSSPFRAQTDGPAYAAMAEAMHEAYGRQMAAEGQGATIPLCTVLSRTYPEAEVILMGVEEPASLTHEPNESVHPGEIETMALVEALFLHRYATAVAS